MGLSTAFVLGICAMFTPLGVVAGYSGSLFGSALSNPWVSAFVAVVLLALAAAMFGAFEFTLPASLNNRMAAVSGASPRRRISHQSGAASLRRLHRPGG
jgi:thiol:disulfide interchange protein DsbD